MPRARRWLWLAAGLLFVAVGIVGAVLPLLPTTPFLLLAVLAFSRSSDRLHAWLLGHRHLGPPIRRWQLERVLPVRVKALAVGSMLLSLAWVAFAVRPAPWLLAAMALFVAGCAAFLLSLPSRSRAAP